MSSSSWNPISPYTPYTLLLALLDPWIFLSLSVSHIPATLRSLYRSSSLLSNLPFTSAFSSAWFGTFWATVGPNVRDGNWDRVVALLDGRISQGKIHEERVGPTVGGRVIEVGPGSGLWAGLFAERALRGKREERETEEGGVRQRKGGKGGGVTKVFGVEPSVDMHPQLRESIAKAGLEGTYEIVPVGIESLASSGRVEKESVDSIVTLLCLCSIPDPEYNIKELYSYLKPGGRWYVFEHVRCLPQQGWAMSAYQAVVNVFWPRCLGGCQLRRDTERSLRAAGEWTNIDLVFTEGDQWCTVCPHILGTLTK